MCTKIRHNCKVVFYLRYYLAAFYGLRYCGSILKVIFNKFKF